MGEVRKGFDAQASMHQKLIERLPPLHPSIVKESTDGVGVMLVLPGDTNDGIVRITYESYSYDLAPPYTTVISYIEAPGSTSSKDPFQGVATALTMAAIIDQAARMTKKQILHKVLANKKSAPIFERLREWDIYRYSDSLGVPSPRPVQEDMFTNKVFYSCLYPNTSVHQEFEKFRVDEASQKLADTFPTPMRLLQHRIAKAMIRTYPSTST